MSKVLFIKASDRPVEQAISVKMYDTFLKKYKEINATDEIIELDLFNAELPYYGNIAINGLFKRNKRMELTKEEQKTVELVDQYLTQFLSADKFVFAFPLWNFSVPGPLVTYLSYLAQAGETFKYTEEGAIGLVGDKKVMLLNARGGDYSKGEAVSSEMAMNLVKSNIGLWGIKDPIEIVIEGHDEYPDRAQKIISEGLERTVEAATSF